MEGPIAPYHSPHASGPPPYHPHCNPGANQYDSVQLMGTMQTIAASAIAANAASAIAAIETRGGRRPRAASPPVTDSVTPGHGGQTGRNPRLTGI